MKVLISAILVLFTTFAHAEEPKWKKVNFASVKFHQEHGLDRITVTANLDINLYDRIVLQKTISKPSHTKFVVIAHKRDVPRRGIFRLVEYSYTINLNKYISWRNLDALKRGEHIPIVLKSVWGDKGVIIQGIKKQKLTIEYPKELRQTIN